MLSIPRIIGHRGARAHAPENTLAGIREGARQGARWVEVDVKLTADLLPILMHDEELERTTDGTGAVIDTGFDAIRRLSANRGFAPAHQGERVPTLAETLALCLELDLGINLEIKPCPGREVQTARVMLEQARALWPANRPPPLVSSFAFESLLEAQRVQPSWPRGLLIDEPEADWAEKAKRIEAATINVNSRYQTAESIAEYRSGGRPVLVYTVNDPARARELFGWGVSAVFTDRPGELLTNS